MNIPEFDTKKELFDFLKENKSKLIESKKSMEIKYTDPVQLVSATTKKTDKSLKADNGENENIIPVKVVANATRVLDSHMDVLMPGCYDETIKERKGLFVHLHDHEWKIKAKVGDVKEVYAEEVSLASLGLTGSGTTECCIFETEIKREYNESIFNQYKDEKINQHSIGLRYVKLELAINDEDSEKEKEFWDKYISQIINPEVAIEKGFFWVVNEIMLLENSAVLFGANHATPTLQTGKTESPEQELETSKVEGKKDSDDEAQFLRSRRFEQLKLQS